MIKTIHPSEPYLEKIAEILRSYEDISKVKVILPTVASCLKLQHLIIKKAKNGACFLPQIVPVINIGVGSEGVYNIPKESIEPISFLEQKIMIADLIRAEQKDITISQSLTLANHIIRLFDELITYEIELPQLYNASAMNDAEHWQYMLGFLLKIHSNWLDIQGVLQKTDMAGYRQNMLQMTISEARAASPIIMAGIIPRGGLIKELAGVLAESKFGLLVLPQMVVGEVAENVPVTSKFWVGSCVIESLRGGQISTLTSELAMMHHATMSTLPNLLAEAKHISDKAQKWLASGAQKVAIVTQNTNLIDMISKLLDAEKIDNINVNGYKLSRTKQYEFFMLLAKAFDSEYGLNLEKVLALLKTPYLFSAEVVDFEYALRKKQLSSDEEFRRHCEEGVQRDNLIHLREIATSPLVTPRNDNSIHKTLATHIALAEKLAPNIWSGDEGKVFSELLYDLLQIDNLPTCNIKDYIEFLEQTISGARYFKSLQNQPILFMNLEEASLGGYEYVICADMNEGSIPPSVPHDPWMNTQMRLSIGLPDVAENIGIQWYYFTNLLYRKNVHLTRSNKVGGQETLASRFWRDLPSPKLTVQEEFIASELSSDTKTLGTQHQVEHSVEPSLFPAKISATNVELLIRNPYGFYAKYILGLRKLENVFEQNTLAKFGNFLHNSIEEYTNRYSAEIADKYAFIMEIGTSMAAKYSKEHINLWWPKFSNVMKEFIAFDEERRADGRKVLAEIYGEMPIRIGDKTVNITAIADRVEQDSAGNIYILDYKTGTLPTKQDIIRGISVQMLVEAMIVDVDGFKEVKGRPYELTYVKIASRTPYIETVTYKVDELDLPAHKDGLYRILEYYMRGEFGVNDNPKFAPKYNDYKHLARKG